MHAHAHGHGHAHEHGAAGHDRAFAVAIALNLGFVAIEGGAGFLANSLALLADAGHNLGDVLGLALAWGAAALARRRPTRRRTYGFGRSSVLAALANAMVLLVAVGAIGWEAVWRLGHPAPVEGSLMIGVAAAGVVVNGATAVLFLKGRHHDLNLRGAFLHMAADAGVSLGVVVAGLLIGATGWLWLDPATSLAIVAVIAWGTWGLFKDSLNLALDAVPEGIDRGAVEDYLRALPGVAAVHDLHIWALSTTETALTVHLVRPEGSGGDAFLAEICEALRRRFAIGHATLQVETGTQACELAETHAV
jgi:cobalt-zinc-cadmium efflux system protein